MHVSVTKRCIVGYGTGALWYLLAHYRSYSSDSLVALPFHRTCRHCRRFVSFTPKSLSHQIVTSSKANGLSSVNREIISNRKFIFNTCISLGLNTIRTWISNHIHYFIRHVLTHQCPYFNDGLTRPTLKLWHGWIVTYHCFTFMQLLIHAIIPILVSLIPLGETTLFRLDANDKSAVDELLVLQIYFHCKHIAIKSPVIELLSAVKTKNHERSWQWCQP